MGVDDLFQIENDWLQQSDISRLAKFIAHWKVYESIHTVPGDIVEIGVHKASSFIRWLTYRELIEGSVSRLVVGFDTFGEFPTSSYKPDLNYRSKFVEEAGLALSKDRIMNILAAKRISHNVELIEGDVLNTVPIWTKNNPDRRIALLHIDVDAFEPSLISLKNLAPLISHGGKILLDDYGKFPGETAAWDLFNSENEWTLDKIPFHTNLTVATKIKRI